MAKSFRIELTPTKFNPENKASFKPSATLERAAGHSIPNKQLLALVQPLKAQVGIPQWMVDNLRAPDKGANGRPSTVPQFGVGRKEQRLSEAGVNAYRNTVRRAAALHYAYYAGLLKAVDDFLANPQMPMAVKYTARRFDLSVRSQGTVGPQVQRRRTVSVALDWAPLTQRTKRTKQHGPFYKGYWKHRGNLSLVYRRHMLDQLYRLTLASFMGSATHSANPVTPVLGGSVRKYKETYYARASARIELGIPLWDRVMDQIISVPFATGKYPSLANFVRGSQYGYLDKKRRKRLSRSERWQTGPDEMVRFATPEARRPWARRLAIEAGDLLQQDVRNIKVLPDGRVV